MKLARSSRASAALAGVLVAVACVPARAHHSMAAYDMSAPVTIDGRLTSVSWRNPHVYLELESAGADGATVSHEVEASAVSVLAPLGVSEDSFPVGETVAVRGFPSRRGTGMLGLMLTSDAGEAVPLAQNPFEAVARPEPERRARSREGVWFASMQQFLAGMPQSLPFNAAGRRITDAMPEGAVVAQSVCTPMPPPLVMLWPVVRTIELDGDTAVIEVDTLETRRTVHLDGRGHPDDVAPTVMGHSIGRWEGETLAVETVGFAENAQGIDFSVPSSPDKRLVERFTLADDGAALRYEATLRDPAYLTEPVEIANEWSYRPDLQPTGEPCDPETARRFLAGE